MIYCANPLPLPLIAATFKAIRDSFNRLEQPQLRPVPSPSKQDGASGYAFSCLSKQDDAGSYAFDYLWIPRRKVPLQVVTANRQAESLRKE